MKLSKKSHIFWLIASVFAYVSSAIWFISSNESLGILWLGIGSLFMCTGAIQYNKFVSKTKDDDINDNKEDSCD